MGTVTAALAYDKEKGRRSLKRWLLGKRGSGLLFPASCRVRVLVELEDDLPELRM